MTRDILPLVLLAAAGGPLPPAAAQTLLWTRQIGTSANDVGGGVAVDGAGNAYISGYTLGSLAGPNAGGRDGFLAKYDASGAPLWTRRLGTSLDDHCGGMAVDGAGNAYVSGNTQGSLGGPNAGDFDGFLSKYDASGNLLWTRQFGTSTFDSGGGVAMDVAGNAYITGDTQGSLGGPSAGGMDVFLAKYDASGNLLWTRQLGTSTYDGGGGEAVDGAGNAYITGSTTGSLGGLNAGSSDAFLAKYDASGNLLWTRQAGTAADDCGYGLAVDGAGNVYSSGYTRGSLGGPSAGGLDAFLAKYDGSGALLWTRQVGTSALDLGLGVGVDGAGNAYITGSTTGSLGGPSAGGWDVFLAKYNASGTLLWKRQTGTSSVDWSYDGAVDGAGNAYLSGYTEGSLGGPNAGGADAFLAKYGPPPCYPDCNADGSLTVADFGCFQTKFVAADPYADCNGDGQRTVADFGCFQTKFVGGCP